MALRLVKLALDSAEDGAGPGDHPRFAMVVHELGNPAGKAVAIARQAIEPCLSDPTIENVIDAVIVANERVRTECARGQGATFAACLVHPSGTAATLVHLGDCRIHALRAGSLECLSRDHTLWNQYVDQGFPPEAIDPNWHQIIVSGLGMITERTDVEPKMVPCTAGDLFLLTTDAVHGRVSHDELRNTLLRLVEDPRAAERAIATMAARRGDTTLPAGVRVIAIAHAVEAHSSEPVSD